MSNELMLMKKDVFDVVETKIAKLKSENSLDMPANYSASNAMKSAWLMLQNVKTGKSDGYRKALEVCDRNSIANSLFDMAVQGLNPSKKQAYFIVYGKELQLQRSYFGTMAVLKRLKGIKSINAQVIYEKDVFEVEIIDGVKNIKKHTTSLENFDNEKIKGAYCIIKFDDETLHTEAMNMQQIKTAWSQSKMSPIDDKGNIKTYTTHYKFTDQMALKTVINRACKYYVNTSDDSDILVESFNNTTDNEYKNDDNVIETVEAEITQEANKTDFQEVVEAEKVDNSAKEKKLSEQLKVEKEMVLNESNDDEPGF